MLTFFAVTTFDGVNLLFSVWMCADVNLYLKNFTYNWNKWIHLMTILQQYLAQTLRLTKDLPGSDGRVLRSSPRVNTLFQILLTYFCCTEIYCTSFPATYFRSWNKPTDKENSAKPHIWEVCPGFLNLLIRRYSRAGENDPKSVGWRSRETLGRSSSAFPSEQKPLPASCPGQLCSLSWVLAPVRPTANHRHPGRDAISLTGFSASSQDTLCLCCHAPLPPPHFLFNLVECQIHLPKATKYSFGHVPLLLPASNAVLLCPPDKGSVENPGPSYSLLLFPTSPQPSTARCTLKN